MPPAVPSSARLASIFAAVALLSSLRGQAAPGRAPTGPIQLDFEGTGGCDEASDFWTRLETRLGRVSRAAGSDPAVRLHVRIVRQGGAFTGELSVTERGAASDKRRVSAKTCGDVLNALSLTAALALDHGRTNSGSPASAESADRQVAPPGAAPAGGSTPPTGAAETFVGEVPDPVGEGPRSDAPAPATPSAPPAQTRPSAEPRTELRSAESVDDSVRAQASTDDSGTTEDSDAIGPLRFGFGARVHVSRLVSPFVGVGGGVFARVAAAEQPGRVRPSVAGAVLHVPNDLLRSPDVAVTWTALAVTACPGLGVSWAAVMIELCAHAAGGWVWAEHRAISNPVEIRRGFATGGGVGRLLLPIAGGLSIDVEAGVAAPLVRRRFVTTSPETEVGDSGWLLWMASLGIGWST